MGEKDKEPDKPPANGNKPADEKPAPLGSDKGLKN